MTRDARGVYRARTAGMPMEDTLMTDKQTAAAWHREQARHWASPLTRSMVSRLLRGDGDDTDERCAVASAYHEAAAQALSEAEALRSRVAALEAAVARAESLVAVWRRAPLGSDEDDDAGAAVCNLIEDAAAGGTAALDAAVAAARIEGAAAGAEAMRETVRAAVETALRQERERVRAAVDALPTYEGADYDSPYEDPDAWMVLRADVIAALDAAEKPAPKVAPVKFDEDGYGLAANGEIATFTPNGWEAELSDHLAVYVALRPGEDAGELLATLLAAVGRAS